MHWSAKRSAIRTPCQLFTGCGGRQRFSRSGGAANGMPRKAFTPLGSVTPATAPLTVCARGALAVGCASMVTKGVSASRAVVTRVLMGSLGPRVWFSVALARSERVERTRHVVCDVRFLGGDRVHRRGKIERQP